MNASAHPPLFAVSTRASAWHAFDWWCAVSHEAGTAGVDLDLTTAVRRRLLGVGLWEEALARPDVTSVWVRPAHVGRILTAASTLAPPAADVCTVEKTIVIQDAAVARGKGDLDDAVMVAARLRDLLDPSLRVALALTPTNASGSRDHLVKLQALRHRAAEWDVDFALDLTSRLDDTWEAEAAILRLGRRLTVLRFGHPLPGLPGSPRWRLMRRILTAAIDTNYAGALTMAPQLRPWRVNRPTDVARSLHEGIVDLRSAFRVRAQVTQEPPWHGKPR